MFTVRSYHLTSNKEDIFLILNPYASVMVYNLVNIAIQEDAENLKYY